MKNMDIEKYSSLLPKDGKITEAITKILKSDGEKKEGGEVDLVKIAKEVAQRRMKNKNK